MSGKYLLDSNIVIALFSGARSVIEHINQSSVVFLPAIALGELYYGAFNSSKQQTNIDRIDQLRTQISIQDCDDTTAKFYGRIKKGLKDQGTPIPENDIWIEAIALQYNLTIATRDSHFNHVDGLVIENL